MVSGILKWLTNKNLKQKYTSALSSFGTAQTVVVLSNAGTTESLKSLIEALKPWFPQPQTLHLITFANPKKLKAAPELPSNFRFNILKPSDFFFFGWPKKQLRTIASAASEADLILNLDMGGNPRMQYMGSLFRKGFVVGLGNAGQESINDLTLETKDKHHFKEVLSQINHYLESLNGNKHA